MKRGGSKPAYADQFNLISPCYKDGEKPAGFHMGGTKKNPKKGKTSKKLKKQKGGSTCYTFPSVSEMGVYDKPSSLEPSASELAWNKRMTGGGLNGTETGTGTGTRNGTGTGTRNGTGNGTGTRNGTGNGTGNGTRNGNGTGNKNNLFSMNLSEPVGNNSSNKSKKSNKLNNVSTYVKKVTGVVFEKENTSSGFAIIVERTTEDPLNSKNDRYTIKVIEKTNPLSMSVLSDQQYSTISQTIRDTSSKVFPLKKQLNNTKNISKVPVPVVNNKKNISKVPVINYSISNENGIANATNAKAANGKGNKVANGTNNGTITTKPAVSNNLFFN